MSVCMAVPTRQHLRKGDLKPETAHRDFELEYKGMCRDINRVPASGVPQKWRAGSSGSKHEKKDSKRKF